MTVKLCNGAEFLHIPKTGGSWITSVLEANGLIASKLGHKHATYDCNLFRATVKPRHLRRERLRAFKSGLANMFRGSSTKRADGVQRFCFVRHPLSWYESWWKYMNHHKRWCDWGERGSTGQWHPNSALNGLGSDDFNEFVRNVAEHRPGYVTELYYAYAKPDVAFIGKTETLREDLTRILEELRLPFDRATLTNSPKVNVSGHASEIRWDPGLRRLVTQLELPALVHFGYGPDLAISSEPPRGLPAGGNVPAMDTAANEDDPTADVTFAGLNHGRGCHPAVLRAA